MALDANFQVIRHTCL